MSNIFAKFAKIIAPAGEEIAARASKLPQDISYILDELRGLVNRRLPTPAGPNTAYTYLGQSTKNWYRSIRETPYSFESVVPPMDQVMSMKQVLANSKAMSEAPETKRFWSSMFPDGPAEYTPQLDRSVMNLLKGSLKPKRPGDILPGAPPELELLSSQDADVRPLTQAIENMPLPGSNDSLANGLEALQYKTTEQINKLINVMKPRKILGLALTPESTLVNWGPAGQEYAQRLMAFTNRWESLFSKWAEADMSVTGKFSPQEQKALRYIIEGDNSVEAPPNVFNAAMPIRNVLNEVIDTAHNAKIPMKVIRDGHVEWQPIVYREDYHPHVMNREARDNLASSRMILRDHYAGKGVETDEDNLRFLVSEYFDPPPDPQSAHFAGNLQRPREIDIPEDLRMSPRAERISYYNEAARKIALQEVFGDLNTSEPIITDQGLAHLDRLTRQLVNEGRSPAYLADLRNLMTGQKYGTMADDLVNTNLGVKARAIQNMTKMSLSFVNNLSTQFNVPIRTNMTSWLKAYSDFLTQKDATYAWARKSGAMFDDLLRLYLQDEADPLLRTTSKMLEGTLFGPTERMNRVIAATSGKYFATEMMQRLMLNPQDAYATRQLASMQIQTTPHALAEDELMRAAKFISDSTQGKTGILDLPVILQKYGKEGELLRMMAQYKQFSFRQSVFFLNDVVMPAILHKDWGPLLKAIPAWSLSATMLGMIGDVARGKDPNERFKIAEKGLLPLALDVNNVNAMGLASSAVNASGNEIFIQKQILGPTASDLAEIYSTLSQPVADFTHEKEMRFDKYVSTVVKNLIRRMPFLGPILTRMYSGKTLWEGK